MLQCLWKTGLNNNLLLTMSTMFFSFVTPDQGSTILFSVVHNYTLTYDCAQYWHQNIVYSCYNPGSILLPSIYDMSPTNQETRVWQMQIIVCSYLPNTTAHLIWPMIMFLLNLISVLVPNYIHGIYCQSCDRKTLTYSNRVLQSFVLIGRQFLSKRAFPAGAISM